ncbi:hypothetical protein LCGC14_1141120 [marine sediment metagenome]|uniref:Bbp19-like phage domain-containing protein n=1 Tax=marine sediment metagenome TaxID=412755 RepID=A0A0F9M322_9ZZZZ
MDDQKLNEKRLLYEAYYLTFMTTEYGKRVLDDLTETYLDVLSFDKDTHQTAFNEGGRNVVAEIKRFIQYHEDPEAIPGLRDDQKDNNLEEED